MAEQSCRLLDPNSCCVTDLSSEVQGDHGATWPFIGDRKKFELRSGKFEKQAVHISPFTLQTSNFKLPLRASERFPESASLWLRTSASQNELGMVVHVGDGNIEHGVRVDGGSQTACGEADTEMPGMRWRVDMPWLCAECTSSVSGV